MTVTQEEYSDMKADVAKYMDKSGLLTDLEREDRAFLIHEINEYEIEHNVTPRTFVSSFVHKEMAWWAKL